MKAANEVRSKFEQKGHQLLLLSDKVRTILRTAAFVLANRRCLYLDKQADHGSDGHARNRAPRNERVRYSIGPSFKKNEA